MSWMVILWAMMAAVAATLASIYLVAWLLQRGNASYLMFVVLAASVAGLAGTELWMLRAQTAEEYGVALRWLHAAIESALAAQRCSGGVMNFDDDEDTFEVYDVRCNDRKMEVYLNSSFEIVRMTPDR